MTEKKEMNCDMAESIIVISPWGREAQTIISEARF